MTLRIGFHVSIAGGISNSVDNAKELGCSAFQIFSRNPRGWVAKPLVEDDAKSFRMRLTNSGIEKGSIVVHMPYLPNLSGPDGECFEKSVNTLIAEMERCRILEIPQLVVHLGSHLGRGKACGIGQLIKAFGIALDNFRSKGCRIKLILENSAGGNYSIGSNFEEIGLVLDRLDSTRFGVCLDTCHAFVSGYPIQTLEGVDQMVGSFDSSIGLSRLKIVHLNDSKYPIKSRRDRHQHIGLGEIGRLGIGALLKKDLIQRVPIIMETPNDSVRGDLDNLKIVMDLINVKTE